ncbi:hypothetical protein AURDEDRAFT_170531 [Auricularia subglabra TFB-10046 SS5]|nr:hypothetical protein AURDEDRAFT_170531 [Auricularia subglabra TFB-10046 SS5]
MPRAFGNRLKVPRTVFWLLGLFAVLPPLASADPGAVPSSIPLKFDRKSGKYVAEVIMGSHGTIQKQNFAISTGLRYSAVASTKCLSCAQENKDVYNPGLSATFQSLPGTATVSYGGVDLSGGLSREDCNLTALNSQAPWPYPNQTLVLVNGSQSALDLFSGEITGVIGLSTGAPDGGSVLDTVLGKWLSTHKANQTFDYGMALNDLSSTLSQGTAETLGAGQLHMLAPDPSAYNESELTWSDATSAVLGQGTLPDQILFPSDFVCNSIQGWTFTWSDGSVFTPQKASSPIVFEPWYPALIFPSGYASTIYGRIAGAGTMITTQPGSPVQWSVPCTTTNLTWTPQFGSLQLPMSNLVQKIEGSEDCVGAIQGWADPAVDSYVLGSPFMTNAYIIHQTSRSGHNKVGIAPRTTPESVAPSTTSPASVTTAALVGGLVGGLLGGLLLLSISGLFFWRRWRNKAREAAAIAAADGQTTTIAETSEFGDAVTPFLSPPTSAGLSSPHGTESTFAHQQAESMQELKGNGQRRNLSVMAAPPTPRDEFHNSSAWYGDPGHSVLPPAYNE